MNRAIVSIAVACVMISSTLQADSSKSPSEFLEGKVLWSESQGVLGNYAIFQAPNKNCPGDLFVDLKNVSLPENTNTSWQVNTWVEITADSNAFVLRTEADDLQTNTSSESMSPTAEVIFGCRESTTVSRPSDRQTPNA